MKKVTMFLVAIMFSILVAGCSSNSPLVNWAPGIGPDQAAGICDQDRSEVCSMWGDLDAAYTIISTYMILSMDKDEALKIISDARAHLSTPGLMSGQMLSKIASSNDAKKIAFLCYKLGFDFRSGLDGSFLFDKESILTLTKYLDKLDFEVNTFSMG